MKLLTVIASASIGADRGKWFEHVRRGLLTLGQILTEIDDEYEAQVSGPAGGAAQSERL